MQRIPQIARAMQDVLTHTATRLERSCGFVQRASKITGAAFTQAWVFACLATPMPTWEDISQSAATCGVVVSPQALQQRCSKQAASVLEQVLQAAVKHVISAESVAVELLNRFAGVFVEDSSTITLPDALSDVWTGCGNATGQGTAAVKMQVQLDLTRGTLHGPLLQDGRSSDHTSPLRQQPFLAGALYLADLGYWSVERFAAIAQAGAFWLTRYQPTAKLLGADGSRWDDVVAVLEAYHTTSIDVAVTIGVRQRLAGRLVAVRVPQEVADQRRRRLREEATKNGKTVSASQLALAAWTIFLTNVPSEQLSVQEVLVLGRSRWQIELMFKLWKSHAHVDESRGGQVWRVLCEVYAKLIGVVVTHWVMLSGAWDNPHRSLVKATKLIHKHAMHLASCLYDLPSLEAALGVIQRGLQATCRLNTRHTHPNTSQLLLDPELLLYGA